MKTSDMIGVLIGAGAAAAVLMVIFKKKAPGTGQAPSVQPNTYNTTEVLDANGQRFSNGWRYFSDGTSIDPKGNYYYQGTLVYRSQYSYVT